jgi:hypothetical protein
LDQLDVGGNDTYQALVLAINSLQAMVETFNEKYMDSKLRYLTDDDLDLRLRPEQYAQK